MTPATDTTLPSILTKFCAIKALARFQRGGSQNPYFTSAQKKQFVQTFHDLQIERATYYFANAKTFTNWLSCEAGIPEFTLNIFKKLGLEFDLAHLPVNYTINLVKIDDTLCEWGETGYKRSLGSREISIEAIKEFVSNFLKPSPPCKDHPTCVTSWIAFKISAQFVTNAPSQTSEGKRKGSPSFFTDEERDSFILKTFDLIENDVKACLDNKRKFVFTLFRNNLDEKIVNLFKELKIEYLPTNLLSDYSIEVMPQDENLFTCIEFFDGKKGLEETLNCEDVEKRLFDNAPNP